MVDKMQENREQIIVVKSVTFPLAITNTNSIFCFVFTHFQKHVNFSVF